VATTSPINAHPLPTDSDSPLGGTQIQTAYTHSEKYSNMRPTSAANRTTLIPSPNEGMETYRQDVNIKEIYDGTKWVPYIQGAKLIAVTGGAGAVNATAGPLTVHGSQTISDPFGTGVPFLLVIYARISTVASSGGFASFQLVIPALSTNVAQTAFTPTLVGGASFLYAQVFASGGSQSYSTRVTDITGTITYYADITNNYIYYFALPLWT
jgi:hypothetical protein